MLAEEFGLAGAAALLTLYLLVFAYGVAISLRCRNHFGRLLAFGVTVTFFIYVFVNVAMVTGLIPVVGVPLPLISYGGTAMMTVMVAVGLLLCVYVHRDVAIGRYADSEAG
jgi:rod shape determining protein RodA